MCGRPGGRSAASTIRRGGGQATISAACAAEQNVGRGPGDGPLGDLAASWSVTTGRVFTKERAGSPAGFS